MRPLLQHPSSLPNCQPRPWPLLDEPLEDTLGLGGAQSSDGVQQLEPVTDCCDAKLLQSLVRQARENRLVYVILAEDRLVLPEAQAPQPDHDVHDGAPYSGLLHIIVPSGGSVQEARNGRG